MPLAPCFLNAQACRVEAQRLFDGLRDRLAKDVRGQRLTVHVGNIGPQHKGGLLLSRHRLKEIGLSHAQLNGIGLRVQHGIHGSFHVFDARHRADFIEKSMVDGDIKTFSVGGEHSIKSRFNSHRGVCSFYWGRAFERTGRFRPPSSGLEHRIVIGFSN